MKGDTYSVSVIIEESTSWLRKCDVMQIWYYTTSTPQIKVNYQLIKINTVHGKLHESFKIAGVWPLHGAF